MEEISNYEESLALLKAIRDGAEEISFRPGNVYSLYGYNHLPAVRSSSDNPEHLFRLYHQNNELPPDHRGDPFVWDQAIEYNGEKVALGTLILKLEQFWNEYKMLNEGGA